MKTFGTDERKDIYLQLINMLMKWDVSFRNHSSSVHCYGMKTVSPF